MPKHFSHLLAFTGTFLGLLSPKSLRERTTLLQNASDLVHKVFGAQIFCILLG